MGGGGGGAGCDLLFHCTVKVVVLLLVGGIYESRNLEMFSVIELQVLTMSLSDMGFCVFSLGSICVVLKFWIRVVVGSMFRYTVYAVKKLT